jgi:hypothetical protein
MACLIYTLAQPEERGAIMPESVLHVSWKSVAIALGILSVSLSATLVVVLATQNIDILSTVALSLAIIAFVAQLLIFIAQNGVAIEQSRQSLVLNAETKGLLVEIRTHASGSESILRTHFTKLLEYITDPTGPKREALSNSGATTSRFPDRIDDSNKSWEDDPRWVRLHSAPSNPDAVFNTLIGLTGMAIMSIIHYAHYLRTSLISGLNPNMWLAERHPLAEELASHGLVTIYWDSNVPYAALTAEGLDAASLVFVRGVQQKPEHHEINERSHLVID